MPNILVNNTQFYYEDKGEGLPILLIHGLALSGRVFERQIDYLSRRYRVIVPDLRGHGRSAEIHEGHTIAQYARDIYHLVKQLELSECVLLGWSLGGLVVWDYLSQFGSSGVNASVIIAEPPAELNSSDSSLGSMNFESLREAMTAVQTNRDLLVDSFVGSLSNENLSPETFRNLRNDVLGQPASITSAILFDMAVQDYRSQLRKFDVPTLLCYGKNDQMTPLAAGQYLASNLPNAQLKIFDNSGHSPFLEEPEQFNQTVYGFLQSLAKSE